MQHFQGTDRPYGPSIQVVTVYEKTSTRGTRYPVGRLGQARITLLPGEPTEDGVATWKILLQEAPTKAAPVHAVGAGR
jgi:hypothetical protein